MQVRTHHEIVTQAEIFDRESGESDHNLEYDYPKVADAHATASQREILK